MIIDINDFENPVILHRKELKELAKKYEIKIMKKIYINGKKYYIKKYDIDLYLEIEQYLNKLKKNIQDALKD